MLSSCFSKISRSIPTPKEETLKDSLNSNTLNQSTGNINYIDPLLYFSFMILGVVLLIIILFFIKKIKT